MIWLLGAIAAAGVVAYWTFCSRESTRLLVKASDLIVSMAEDPDTSDEEMQSIYAAYRMAQYWVFLPLMAILSPLITFVMVVIRNESLYKSERSKKYQEAMDMIVTMSFVRNPLTAVFCFTVISLSGLISMLIAVFSRKVFSQPSYSGIFSAVSIEAAHRGVGSQLGRS